MRLRRAAVIVPIAIIVIACLAFAFLSAFPWIHEIVTNLPHPNRDDTSSWLPVAIVFFVWWSLASQPSTTRIESELASIRRELQHICDQQALRNYNAPLHEIAKQLKRVADVLEERNS